HGGRSPDGNRLGAKRASSRFSGSRSVVNRGRAPPSEGGRVRGGRGRNQVGTMGAPDCSEDCCGFRLSPSRPFLLLTIAAGLSELSRVSVHKAFDDVPNSKTPPGAPEPRPTLSAGAPWPSAEDDRIGSGDDRAFRG